MKFDIFVTGANKTILLKVSNNMKIIDIIEKIKERLNIVNNIFYLTCGSTYLCNFKNETINYYNKYNSYKIKKDTFLRINFRPI